MNTQKININGVEYQMMDYEAYYIKGFYDSQSSIVSQNMPYLKEIDKNLASTEKKIKETIKKTERLGESIDRLSNRNRFLLL